MSHPVQSPVPSPLRALLDRCRALDRIVLLADNLGGDPNVADSPALAKGRHARDDLGLVAVSASGQLRRAGKTGWTHILAESMCR